MSSSSQRSKKSNSNNSHSSTPLSSSSHGKKKKSRAKKAATPSPCSSGQQQQQQQHPYRTVYLIRHGESLGLDEESVKDNFVLIYELMDETLDYGYPQITDTNILKEYIKTESNKKKINDKNTINTKLDNEISDIYTNQVSWRKQGIVYARNEIYMDVIERVTCLVSANCNTIKSEVRGIVKVKSSLSGMPTCTLGLNDKAYLEIQGKYNDDMKNKTVDMDDLKFHPCVDMNKFETDREIEFVPADGEFVLMNYRLDLDLKPLIWVNLDLEIKSETVPAVACAHH